MQRDLACSLSLINQRMQFVSCNQLHEGRRGSPSERALGAVGLRASLFGDANFTSSWTRRSPIATTMALAPLHAPIHVNPLI